MRIALLASALMLACLPAYADDLMSTGTELLGTQGAAVRSDTGGASNLNADRIIGLVEQQGYTNVTGLGVDGDLLKASALNKLGAPVDPARKMAMLKDVELELLQVPPDERYDALFPFVIGLFNKAKGDVVGARKSLEKSVAMDSSFIPARRELSMLSAQTKKQDVFNMDLKEMVSGFFKKK